MRPVTFLIALGLFIGLFAGSSSALAAGRPVPVAKRYVAHRPKPVRHGPKAAAHAKRAHRTDAAPRRKGKRKASRARARARAGAAAFAGSPTPMIPGGLNAPGVGASYGAIPPDTGGAIGPAHYVEGVTQRGIGVYDRWTMKPVSAMGASSFLGTTSGEPLDAQFIWDPGANRWFYAYVRPVPTNPGRNGHIDYGWSKTADPTDLLHGWCHLDIDTGSLVDDRPKLTTTATTLIFSTNVFNSAGADFSRIFTAPKPANGSTSCPTSQSGIKTFGSASSPLKTSDGDVVFSPSPAVGADDPALGYVFAADAADLPATNTQFMAWHVDASGNLIADGNLTVPGFKDPPLVPQPGKYDKLDSVDSRLTQSVAHFDPDAGAEAVWTQQTIAEPGGSGRAVVRWYELIPGGCNGTTCPSSVIRQQGVVDDPTNYVFNAAISPTMAGNEAVIHYNVGGSGLAAQIRARSRASTTPLGQLGPEITVDTSAGPDDDNTCGNRDTRPGCRWGDYEPATPDPVNPHAVWGTNETIGPMISGRPHWRTRNFGILAAPAPFPFAGSTRVDDADGDGVLEPGESFALTQPVMNAGSGTLAAGNGTLTALTGGVSLSTATAAYGAVAPGATVANGTPFRGTVPAGLSCGTPVRLSLGLGGGASVPVTVPTGQPPAPPAPKSYASTDVPKAIPDNSATGVTSKITISDPGTVRHLTVSIGRLTHTWDGDLRIQLTAPDGTTATLVDQLRSGNDSGDNFIGTVFDDAAAQSITVGTAPYTGRFRPQQALSVFDGKSQQGTWTLRVADMAAQDTGTLSAWSVTPADTQSGATARAVSSDVPKAIPDNDKAGVTSTLTVDDPGTVHDLTVSLDQLTHTWDGDIKAELTGPDGTTVVLVNQPRNGNDSGDNFTNTVFDDGAAQSISSGSAPYSGSFRPEQPLSAFEGKPQQGTWTLKVSDLGALDKGTLVGWSLTPTAGGATASVSVSASPGGPVVRSSTDVPKAIPDNDARGVTSVIDVPDGGTISSLTVTIGSLTHTWDGDVRLELIGPDGTTVVLADRPGTSNNGGKNFTNTAFDDTAPVNLTDASAPYGGTFHPQAGALAAFAGKPLSGRWTLKATDVSAEDTGTLSAWSLRFVPAFCG